MAQCVDGAHSLALEKYGGKEWVDDECEFTHLCRVALSLQPLAVALAE